jgi:hypothetical protein
MRRQLSIVFLVVGGVACGSDPGHPLDALDSASGTGGGQAGILGSGGVRGTGGGGGTGSDGGDTLEVGEPSYCAPCVDETAAKVMACPARHPATAEDLRPICNSIVGAGVPTVTVTMGDCVPLAPLPGCSDTIADSAVAVLSIDFLGGRGGLDCHYSRATGALLGQAVSADSPRYCGGRAYVAATTDVTNAWCRAGGASRLTLTCATISDAGVAEGGAIEGGAIEGGAIEGGSIDVALSACSACGPDELCVAYYDGTCKPMYTTCNKVSAATRQAILVDHERCSGKPMGDEICGTRDGLHFWGCGEPACPTQTLQSDINCYGP